VWVVDDEELGEALGATQTLVKLFDHLGRLFDELERAQARRNASEELASEPRAEDGLWLLAVADEATNVHALRPP